MRILSIAEALLLLPATVLFALALVLSAEVFAATWPRRTRSRRPASDVAFAVVVPAHDEASGIGATLAALGRELGPNGRLLVVADNCTDATAAVARAAGAETIERHDQLRRGKGYALDYGVRHLAATRAPAVVVVVDADCVPDAGAIATLVGAVVDEHRPMQGTYDMLLPAGPASANLRLAQFAWRLKMLVRSQGLANLGLPCGLGGTGMAFPWDVIRKLDLGTGHIVEDIVFGLDCAALQSAPALCAEARFVSVWPTDADARRAQRTRWEAGHVSVITGLVPRYLYRAIAGRNWPLLALLADVSVPPLALLGLAITTIGLLAVLLASCGGPLLPLVLTATAACLYAAAIGVAWRRVGRDSVALADLGSVLAYAASKLTIYVAALRRRPMTWTRTGRD